MRRATTVGEWLERPRRVRGVESRGQRRMETGWRRRLHQVGRVLIWIGGFAAGVSDDVARREHDLREARVAHRAELSLQRPGQRDRVHPEVVEVHAISPAPTLTAASG